MAKKKKENPYKNYNNNIIETFTDYIKNNEDLIKMFIEEPDTRIAEKDWNVIYKHVQDITNKLDNKVIDTKYKYKSKSQWKSIDDLHEKDRKHYIKYFYDMYINKSSNLENYFIGYLIFTHFLIYITETKQ